MRQNSSKRSQNALEVRRTLKRVQSGSCLAEQLGKVVSIKSSNSLRNSSLQESIHIAVLGHNIHNCLDFS